MAISVMGMCISMCLSVRGGDPDWAAKREPVKNAIYDALAQVNGSISAEHGVGS